MGQNQDHFSHFLDNSFGYLQYLFPISDHGHDQYHESHCSFKRTKINTERVSFGDSGAQVKSKSFPLTPDFAQSCGWHLSGKKTGKCS